MGFQSSMLCVQGQLRWTQSRVQRARSPVGATALDAAPGASLPACSVSPAVSQVITASLQSAMALSRGLE